MSKNVFFISDTHFGHANMLTFINYDGTRMRPFDSVEEVDELMIENWNKMVKPTDKVYHLGDCFYKSSNPDQIMNRLNGQKVLCRGNHDRREAQWYLKYFKDVRSTFHIDGNYLLGHFPIHPDSKGRFIRQLHGHCIDDKTEVLTVDGFKNFNDISKNDVLLNLNTGKDIIETDNIKNIISMQYTGEVYHFKSYGIDIRVTDGHRMLYKLYDNKKHQPYRFMIPSEFIKSSKKEFIRAGFQVTDGIPLSDDLVRLLVWIAADGNKCNRDLIRFFLKKERKINRLKNILISLNIPFKEFDRGEYKRLHFTCPKELLELRFKPIDPIILRANRHQADIIREEYANTDGIKNSKNIVIIYTSKKEEAELLQRLFVVNGFGTSIYTRVNHGFALRSGDNKVSYELQVSSKRTRRPGKLKKITEISHVENEHFWCLDTNNGTLIVRRNGRVCITGNCHSQQVMKYEPYINPFGEIIEELIPDPWYRNCCVEVNNYSPIPFEIIKEETEKLIESGKIIIPKKG